MANKKITIKDIARECGVGLGTVSRAINGKPGVKEDIRRKIFQHIEDIGWRSTNLYNRLKTSDEGKAVVFIASTSTFEKRFDNDLLRRLMEEVPGLGFTPVIYYGRCRENLERCIAMKPYAVVVIGISDYQKNLVETLLKNGTKVVGVGQCDEFACPLVFSDPRAGARRAVKLLQKAGHERIGFFGGMGIRKKVEHIEDVNIHFVREMLHGIREVHPSFTLETSAISDCFSDLRNLRGKLKAGGHTAWICSDEKMCRQLLYCANELNIDIPGDISLVSFTPDLPFYSFCLDITRLYSDNSKQAAQIMNLLSNESVMQPEIFTFDYLLNKGQTVRKIKFDKKVVS